MYVCMFELQTYPKHVCMYVWQAQASMYVCMLEAPAEHVCMYVCLSQLSVYVCMSQAYWACMYVCMSQTYIDSNLTPCWACMYVRRWACMYLSKPCVLLTFLPFQLNAPHPEPWPLGDPQKLIHIDTILILVYIHTYILTSRSSHEYRLQLTRARPYRKPQACIHNNLYIYQAEHGEMSSRKQILSVTRIEQVWYRDHRWRVRQPSSGVIPQ